MPKLSALSARDKAGASSRIVLARYYTDCFILGHAKAAEGREHRIVNDAQVIDWLQLLAPSNRERKAIVLDLLRHKATDRMSTEDIIICHRGLRLLDEPGRVPEAAGPRIIFREDLIEV